ncbi:hypothetical protein [Brunnivagina elsteri]|uniref:Uncharacterized protein n=1 Tax=Brunnivagina elsteri CCALA 953 TaxID=987040 RepID=A0A2A2TNM7_9CYAN|nr:hypothetical protein [Calothrix elsteri]PAX60042.1 hypothetical protein CK510_04010 [Calothrix elsteri CCALA 953]
MLDLILDTEINLNGFVCLDEANYLIKQQECIGLAQTRFINGEISFADYCDILELCNVNIDQYLVTVENNLQVIGYS